MESERGEGRTETPRGCVSVARQCTRWILQLPLDLYKKKRHITLLWRVRDKCISTQLLMESTVQVYLHTALTSEALVQSGPLPGGRDQEAAGGGEPAVRQERQDVGVLHLPQAQACPLQGRLIHLR